MNERNVLIFFPIKPYIEKNFYKDMIQKKFYDNNLRLFYSTSKENYDILMQKNEIKINLKDINSNMLGKYHADYLVLMDIKEELTFKRMGQKKGYILDLYSSYKDLSNKSKKIIKLFLLKQKPSYHWIESLNEIFNVEFDISPIKSQYLNIAPESLLNLGLIGTNETYDMGKAFLTKKELKRYKEKAMPLFFNLLEGQEIKELKIKEKRKLIKKEDLKIEELTLIKRPFLDIYTDKKSKSYIFKKGKDNCMLSIMQNKKLKKDEYEIKIYSKAGDLKIRGILTDLNNKEYKMNILNFKDLILKPINGIGYQYLENNEIKKEIYLGLSNSSYKKEIYSDYSKSYKKFFKEIESRSGKTLKTEEKRKIIKAIYRIPEINSMNIYKKIKDISNIDFNTLEDLDQKIEQIELFFSN